MIAQGWRRFAAVVSSFLIACGAPPEDESNSPLDLGTEAGETSSPTDVDEGTQSATAPATEPDATATPTPEPASEPTPTPEPTEQATLAQTEPEPATSTVEEPSSTEASTADPTAEPTLEPSPTEGKGEGTSAELESATPPEPTPTDCNGSNPLIASEADELCDGIDNDCDGAIDEELTPYTYYLDWDGDGYGDSELNTDPEAQFPNPLETCHTPEELAELGAYYYVLDDHSDCDDTDPNINSDADELCDGIDNDCDELVDSDDVGVIGESVWYYDGDGDGYGVEDDITLSCEQPDGFAALAGDCDDANSAYNPGAAEVDCTDSNDYNCDGSVGYSDADMDGSAACEECDDADATVFPNAMELCDGKDNDCDGQTDEGYDQDGDGFLDANVCSFGMDCDDREPTTNPNAEEFCDGVDNDCDGVVDDNPADLEIFYLDGDGDGYGVTTSTTSACEQPEGYASLGGDCDDGNSSVHPYADELCDGVDNDCDSAVDEGCVPEIWYISGDTVYVTKEIFQGCHKGKAAYVVAPAFSSWEEILSEDRIVVNVEGFYELDFSSLYSGSTPATMEFTIVSAYQLGDTSCTVENVDGDDPLTWYIATSSGELVDEYCGSYDDPVDLCHTSSFYPNSSYGTYSIRVRYDKSAGTVTGAGFQDP